MKRYLGLLGIIFLISIVLVEGLLSFYFYKNPIKETIHQDVVQKTYISTKTNLQLELDKLDKVNKQPESLSQLYVTGWIPDWDIPAGLDTIKEQTAAFNSISPVWFYAKEDGSLETTPYTNGPALTSYLKDNNLELIPTIALFDPDIFSKILNSDDALNKHVNEIVKATKDNNYDGIDLDYESTLLADKGLFYKFLEKLSAKFKDMNKRLVFTLLAKWGDYIEYPTLPQTRRVQDYKRIAGLVDEIRIMAYDFTGRTSPVAGPNSPLAWVEQIIKYTVSLGIPRNKILLGVPTYSYDYSDRPIASDNVDLINWFTLSSSNLESGVAYFNKQVNEVKDKYDLTEKFNDSWGEAIGTYDYKGDSRIIIYPTEKSFELRKQLAADYGLKGISYWRIGQEDGLKL